MHDLKIAALFMGASLIAASIAFGEGAGRAPSFEAKTPALSGPSAWDASLGDVDGDGDLDLYLGLALWLNDGKAAFTKTATSFGSSDAWLADLDGDGIADAVCGKSVFLNDGAGKFRKASSLPGDFEAMYAKAADLDGDWDLDLICADEARDLVCLNDGKGNFRGSGEGLGGWAQCRYAVGDLDGDGIPDVYAAIPHGPPPAMSSARDRIWFGLGKGKFASRGDPPAGVESRDAFMADFDGNGGLDVFVADGAGSSRLLLNDGRGALRDGGQRINSEYHAAAAAAADFDGDGDLDLMIANGKPLDRGQPNVLWLNDGRGGFKDSGLRLGDSNSIQLGLGDLDGDGDIDAVFANVDLNAQTAPVEVWLNAGGALSYPDTAPPGGVPRIFAPGTVSVAGLNTHTLAFSPTGDMLIFSRYPQAKSYVMEKGERGWAGPVEAPFPGMEASFSPDGKRLFFHSGYDLYRAEIGEAALGKGASIGKSVALGPGINTEAVEFYPSVAADGTLYFSRNGKWNEGRIMAAEPEGEGYGPPVDLGPLVNEGGALHAFVVPDESFLIFNSPRPGSLTKLDLWISFTGPDGKWGKPKNLGDAINGGSYANLCPKLSPDGRYLFYTKFDIEGTGLVYWVEADFLMSLRD